VADALEQALRDLSAAIDTGPVPDVAPAVLSRLREPPRVEHRRPWLRIAIAAVVLALAAALVPDVRTAVADSSVTYRGVVFNTSESTPRPSRPCRGTWTAASAARWDSLTRSTLEAARSAVSFPVVRPPVARARPTRYTCAATRA